MPPGESDVHHKRLRSFLVATAPFQLKNREEVHEKLSRCRQVISEELIAGPGFGIFQFVTSVKEGLDVELGFPVTRKVKTEDVKTWTFPGMEVLSLIHSGPQEDIRESYRKLYGHAAERGIISDEFCRDVPMSFPSVKSPN